MAEQARFYFQDPRPYDEKAAKKFLTPKIKPVVENIMARLGSLPEWTETSVNQCFQEQQQETGLKMKEIAQAVRLALTGRTASPGLFEIMEILGREEVARRLQAAIEACT
jgi:glutamyl-tRNA synthetase